MEKKLDDPQKKSVDYHISFVDPEDEITADISPITCKHRKGQSGLIKHVYVNAGPILGSAPKSLISHIKTSATSLTFKSGLMSIDDMIWVYTTLKPRTLILGDADAVFLDRVLYTCENPNLQTLKVTKDVWPYLKDCLNSKTVLSGQKLKTGTI